MKQLKAKSQVILLGNFSVTPPLRTVKLVGITPWHIPTSKDTSLYKLRYWWHEQWTDWPDGKAGAKHEK